jgi:hypothetical protein
MSDRYHQDEYATASQNVRELRGRKNGAAFETRNGLSADWRSKRLTVARRAARMKGTLTLAENNGMEKGGAFPLWSCGFRRCRSKLARD